MCLGNLDGTLYVTQQTKRVAWSADVLAVDSVDGTPAAHTALELPQLGFRLAEGSDQHDSMTTLCQKDGFTFLSLGFFGARPE